MQSKRNDIIALLLSMCVPSLAALVYFVLLGESPAARIVYAFEIDGSCALDAHLGPSPTATKNDG